MRAGGGGAMRKKPKLPIAGTEHPVRPHTHIILYRSFPTEMMTPSMIIYVSSFLTLRLCVGVVASGDKNAFKTAYPVSSVAAPYDQVTHRVSDE